MSNLDKISSIFNAKIDSVKTKDDLQNIKTEFFGKNGQITQQFKSLGSLVPEKRKEFASNLNIIKDDLTFQLEQKNIEIETIEINEKLKNEKVDVTLPIRPERQGKIHPVSQVIDEISSIFSEIGFSVAEGPDVETEYNNFTALNTPEDHPARDMHDTFYLDGSFLLRTHTSSVQIHAMEDSTAPLRVLAPGRVYRCDSDPTHSPMFHQIEGLCVDHDITFSNLKWILNDFIQQFFQEKNIKTRFRPSYFPFTEPSAEMDILFNGKWLEVLGCGMVHPNVLKNVNINPKKFSGFAFGLGIERFAMLSYKIKDLRFFFENDMNFLEQFKHIR